jgi:hypothetical protein
MTIAVSMAAFVSRRRSRRGVGADGVAAAMYVPAAESQPSCRAIARLSGI